MCYKAGRILKDIPVTVLQSWLLAISSCIIFAFLYYLVEKIDT